jgi:hypothetical protein
MDQENVLRGTNELCCCHNKYGSVRPVLLGPWGTKYVRMKSHGKMGAAIRGSVATGTNTHKLETQRNMGLSGTVDMNCTGSGVLLRLAVRY